MKNTANKKEAPQQSSGAKSSNTNSITENTKNVKIVMLPINELSPHPNNVRRELGDLTELAASIKQNGVYQNLTVVPIDSGYRVVIGHRRLAAAKLAGLTELPCVITEMTDREQLEVMLMENLQREGLKITEEVNGFEQLRLSGAEVGEISKATGFSERSVRRRLNYADKIGVNELIQAETKAENAGRQITLHELDKVCKISDEDERKKLIVFLGTPNFRWMCETAESNAKYKKANAECVKILEGLGIKPTDYAKMYAQYDAEHRIYKNVSDILKLNPTTRADIIGEHPETAVYYANPNSLSTYLYFCLGKPNAKHDSKVPEQDKDNEKHEQERRMRKEKLDAEFNKAYKLRHEFMKNLTNDNVSGYSEEIAHFLASAIIDDPSPSYEDVAEIFGIDADELEYEDFKDELYACIQYLCGKGDARTSALCVVAKLAYVLWEDSAFNPHYDCAFNANDGHIERLKMLYGYLDYFDYEISDAEENLLDGSSEWYFNKKE